MQIPQPTVCKPTSWFALRALAMLGMFSVFSVMFYIDGNTGYRKKNWEYYLHATFQKAADKFSIMKGKGDLTAKIWNEYATQQKVNLPSDITLLPKDIKLAEPWPAVLTDYDLMKLGQPHILWQNYSGEKHLAKSPPKHPFDAAKIREQMFVFYICFTLALVTLFFLIRTMRRSLRTDSTGLTTVTGKVIPYADMKILDLRKWDTKGLAVVEFTSSGVAGRAKIDGLTYGGFKKENGEPAEKLIMMIRENLSGEIIEYTSVEATKEAQPNTEEA